MDLLPQLLQRLRAHPATAAAGHAGCPKMMAPFRAAIQVMLGVLPRAAADAQRLAAAREPAAKEVAEVAGIAEVLTMLLDPRHCPHGVRAVDGGSPAGSAKLVRVVVFAFVLRGTPEREGGPGRR
jgi:hypothetical protein